MALGDTIRVPERYKLPGTVQVRPDVIAWRDAGRTDCYRGRQTTAHRRVSGNGRM